MPTWTQFVGSQDAAHSEQFSAGQTRTTASSGNFESAVRKVSRSQLSSMLSDQFDDKKITEDHRRWMLEKAAQLRPGVFNDVEAMADYLARLANIELDTSYQVADDYQTADDASNSGTNWKTSLFLRALLLSGNGHLQRTHRAVDEPGPLARLRDIQPGNYPSRSKIDELNGITGRVANSSNAPIPYRTNLKLTETSKDGPLLSALQGSVTTQDFEEFLRGGQFRIPYDPEIMDALLSLGAEVRRSSHYKNTAIPTAFEQEGPQYGLNGDVLPTVLFGKIRGHDGKEYMYLQAERNSFNQGGTSLSERVAHAKDGAKYFYSQINQGPYGESNRTDADPMGGTDNPPPTLADRLDPMRAQALLFYALHGALTLGDKSSEVIKKLLARPEVPVVGGVVLFLAHRALRLLRAPQAR